MSPKLTRPSWTPLLHPQSTIARERPAILVGRPTEPTTRERLPELRTASVRPCALASARKLDASAREDEVARTAGSVE
jgi:hypothetical protein